MFLSLFFFLYYTDIYVISVTYRMEKRCENYNYDGKKRFQYSDIIQNLKNDYIKFEKCNEYKKLGKLQKGKGEEKNILQDHKPIYT